MVKTKGLPRIVEIPSTARDWELYSTMPGSTSAARRLTAALKKAGRSKLPDAEAWKILDAALDAEIEFGACDSEPLWHARKAFNALRGCIREW
jgi:hypothetical protein